MPEHKNLKCKYCSGICVKNGKQKNGKQRFKCKSCRKKQQKDYLYQAHNSINNNIIAFIREGVGVRSIARLLHISATTLMKRIKEISYKITIPPITINSVFEVDEIKTFVGRKRNHNYGLHTR